MTKEGMTKQEKTIVEGMAYILNQDLCGPFECPEEGCDVCPIHNAAIYLEKFISALYDIPIIEGENPSFFHRRAKGHRAPFLYKMLYFTPFFAKSLCILTNANFPFSIDFLRPL